MTEAYCSNAVVGANSPIPFNNISIQKGCTSILSAPGTIQLNKKGVYMVDVNTSAIAGVSANQCRKCVYLRLRCRIPLPQ